MKSGVLRVGLIFTVAIAGVIFFATSRNTVDDSFAGPEKSLDEVLWIGSTRTDLEGGAVSPKTIRAVDSTLIAFFRDKNEVIRNPFPNSGPPEDMPAFLKVEGADHGLSVLVVEDSAGLAFTMHIWPGLSEEITLRTIGMENLEDLMKYALLEVNHPTVGGMVEQIKDTLVVMKVTPWTGHSIPRSINYWRKVSGIEKCVDHSPCIDTITGYYIPGGGYDISVECPDDWEIFTGIKGKHIDENFFTFEGGIPKEGDMAREAR